MDEKDLTELKLLLKERETELQNKQEELDSQREMLSSAIEELEKYTQGLIEALNEVKLKNTELEKLLYQSSHGLKSPLSSISGIIDLLSYETVSDEVKEYLAHIDGSVSQMIEIMNSLTTLATLTSYQVKDEWVNIDNLVRQQLNYFEPLAKSNSVSMKYQSMLKNETLQTDSFLLNSVLKQIIMNGIIFRNHKIESHLTINAHLVDNKLRITIEDNGEGIDASIENEVYEMFFKGSNKSTGSGLGLFIVKRSIDMLGGSINFTSSSAGTVFRLHIPALQS